MVAILKRTIYMAMEISTGAKSRKVNQCAWRLCKK